MTTTTSRPAAAGTGAQLNVDDLLSRARAAAGLSDFGDPWFLGPLGKVVELVNAEGGLHSADEPPVRTVVKNLADRLRLVDYLKRHPGVRDEQVDVAGIIIGLPRGGSTLLQRLLAASPQLTSTYTWELHTPVPLPDEQPGNPVGRQQIAIDIIDAMHEQWPDMKSIHPLDAFAVDEEVLLMERSFLCLMYPNYFNIPSYDLWQLGQDHAPAYRELKLWLQLLQYQAPDRKGMKWILKSPQHLIGGGLRTMLDTFPKAKAIMTHRPLESVISSYCSNQATCVGPYSSTYDQKALGQQAIKLFAAAIRTMMAVRAGAPDRFIDVYYRDTIDDPVAVFSRVMKEMGLTVGPEDEEAARAFFAANGRERHPPHHYKPEDFGVTQADFDAGVGFYRDAFLS